jgi:hypothetical protein
MHPRDKSINIGWYNNCLVISDDFQLTEEMEEAYNHKNLSDYEEMLCELFPGKEILTVACHSVVNLHLYALAKDNERLRYKMVASESPVVEFGERLAEEEQIYARSKIIDGVRLFKSDWEENGDYEYMEEQMMEDFAFGIAKRHLGVMISTGEDEELMYTTPFKKYVKGKKEVAAVAEQQVSEELEEVRRSWWSRLFGQG